MKKLIIALALSIFCASASFGATVFSDTFESGSLGASWSTYKTANGRVQVTTGTAYAGSYSLKLDAYPSGTYSYAAGILTVDLSGKTGSRLKFYWREYGDENHTGDGVFISTDGGSTWTKILSFNNGPSSYRAQDLDISALDGKSNAKIKFQFYDNYAMYSDGYAIDNVEVTATDSGSSGGSEVTLFQDNFDASTLGSSWSTSGIGNWQVSLTSSYTPYSTPYHVTLSASVSGSYETSQLILSKDLSAYTGVKVEFYYKEYGDENHTSDGLYIYNGSWIKVLSFNGGPSSWTKYTVDLSAYSGITKIKWQQYDNYRLSSDGVCIDNVKVTGIGSSGPVASSKAGMGAIPYTGGVTFRVWAPNATAVTVGGTFNGWSATASPLASEGNGYWSADITTASANAGYKFVITHAGGTLWKNDPYAREVTSSVGNSVIKDRNYTWSSFSMPSWGEMVIYEAHVKTWTDGITGTQSRFEKLATKAGLVSPQGVTLR